MKPITRLALVLAGALALAAPATAQTKWNLPGAYPQDNPHTENLTLFAKDVADATGGKLQITVHPGASLFKAPDIKRAVQTGQAQMGEVLISNHENEDPIYGLGVVPFLATSYDQAKKLWDAQKSAVEKKLATQGIMLLFAVPWAPQGLYAKKDINTLEDLKGAKWRAYNVGTSRIAELVGAQAVTVQAAELPQALATGVVNAFITSGATGYDAKVWESLTHFYDVQAWIPKAAATAEERGWKIWREKSTWYLDQLKAKGMKVQPPGPELAAGFRKLGEQLTADWLKKAGAEGQAIVEAYRKSVGTQ